MRPGWTAYPQDALSALGTTRSNSVFRARIFSHQGRKKRRVGWAGKAIGSGHDVQLIYIGLASAELARMRVAQRVAAGGHTVPAEKVASRYPRSRENLAKAMEFVPAVFLFDNSTHAEYRRLGIFEDGRLVEKTGKAIPQWAQRFFAQ